MRLPTTTSEYVSDSVGYASADWFKQLALIGCSSGGTANEVLVKSTGDSIQSAFGYGFLHRFGRRAIEKTGAPLLLVKAAAAAVGSCGATRYATSLTAAESVAPDDIGVVVFSGAAYDAFQLGIHFSTGGVIGTAYYQLTEDGGYTWSTAKLLTGAIVIAEKNVTITPDDGAGEFETGNVFWCDTVAPVMNEAGLTAALDALNAYTNKHPAIVVVGQGWADADIDDIVAACEETAPEGEGNLNTYTVLLNSRKQTALETDDEFREAIEALTFVGEDSPRTIRCWGQTRVRDSVTRTKPLQNTNEEAALAMVTRGSMILDVMQPGVGVLEDVMDADIVIPSTDLLVQQNWLCVRELPGREGEFFISAGLLNASDDTDMVFLHYRQCYDAITNRFRVFGQNYYGKPMTVDSTTGIITSAAAARFNKAFETAAASLVDGEVVLGLSVDTSESYLDGKSAILKVRYRISVAASIGAIALVGTLQIGL